MGRRTLQASSVGIKQIKASLKKKRWTQDYLGGVVGCSRTTIWSLLNRFFGYFYGNPGSKSLKALLCRHFIENMEIIVYNPCPVRVLLSSILNHHKRDARAVKCQAH